ncbi:hypothetical protein BpHYR1_001498 [Brachionus plicatilis]|uniref:Uncharacterized protein n=1 Tax=Brachionus plicatilis TaxID=10195 RepID=A0A3M7QE37_BRAPC|nr:hypothetical protein BpHYR1_001498 [Brachionus plicatilis]
MNKTSNLKYFKNHIFDATLACGLKTHLKIRNEYRIQRLISLCCYDTLNSPYYVNYDIFPCFSEKKIPKFLEKKTIFMNFLTKISVFPDRAVLKKDIQSEFGTRQQKDARK